MGGSSLVRQIFPSYLMTALLSAAVAAAAMRWSPWPGLVSAAAAILASMAIAWLVGWRVARAIALPLERLRRAANRLQRGDHSQKLPASDIEEIAELAETFNHIVGETDARLRDLLRQRNEREAVLASMVEGVVAVDSDERVINLNEAGAELLEVERQHSIGRSLPEVVRNPALERLVSDVLLTQHTAYDEIELTMADGERRTLHVQGSVLHDAQEQPMGAMVVLHDVTRIKRLENVRRDFVANVSHELKTPITSIKGFVETLLDGAMHQPEDAERFLRIVAGQADRLNAIIEDLLMLSRVEQEEKQIEIALDAGQLKDVLDSAILACQRKADEKQIRLELACEEDLVVRMNAVLLEQAVTNLIDNAIKYSAAGQQILIQAHRDPMDVVIKVQDRGCGIPREHLPRIFERFYRVDKARSRELGGTGLGLAIVKHIVQAHGGRATVKSAVGEGSTFSLHLPALSPVRSGLQV